ncbi:MAG: DUF1841 family protein [Myxococcales bacterium]|nr:DUF1841 family protein [Myxococcales bacterium]MCB9522634.1 DUF1841 family protein [Myxococcales bacterium]
MSQPQNDGKVVIELQGIDKRHLAYVWEKMKRGDELAGQEIFIGRSMADHPQWFPHFETIGLLEGDDELPDGTNPFAHVSLHVLIGSQIFNQNPPEAETFYRMRLRKGDEQHAIIHMMIETFQRHLLWAAQHRGPDGQLNFDMGAYAGTLRKLWHLKTNKLWRRLGYAEPPVPHEGEGP